MDTLYVGMDLGTYKTSVACSNGKREVLQTAIGWPKDYVSRSMLGCDVVFGEDTVENRLALDVVRPFEKGALKYLDRETAGLAADEVEKHLEAARLIVRHAVSLVCPEDATVYGVIGAPSRSTRACKQMLLEIAREAFDAAVIVPEPFTVAYGMNELADVCIIDIGAGTTDICPMTGTYPRDEDQHTVPLGGDAVDRAFLESMAQHHPEAQLSMNMARRIKEKYGFVHDVNEVVEVTLPCNGQPRTIDVTKALTEACRTLVEPIVEGLREVIRGFDPEFQQRLLDNVVLAGGGSQLRGLDALVERSLAPYGGGSVRRVYDSVFAGASGALKLAMSMPADNWADMRSSTETPSAA